MQIIRTIKELRKNMGKLRREGRSIGFVPTMGFLHQGHLSLIQRARKENDCVVVSVFVNPTQFAPGEDLEAYPRNEKRDIELMRGEGTDIAFFPSVEELYPPGFTTYVAIEGSMTQILCGRSRSTHFRGVTTIVTKLFHLVTPSRAYFGQKDAQQAAVISRMVRDLNFDLQIVVCPTVREPDGLAMSSRNSYLSPRQRADAAVLSKALFEARALIEKGERRSTDIINHIRKRIESVEAAQIDYAEVVDAATLETRREELSGEILIAVAVRLGRTRLIDNIKITVP